MSDGKILNVKYYYKLLKQHVEYILLHSYSDDKYDDSKIKDNIPELKNIYFEDYNLSDWCDILFYKCNIILPKNTKDNAILSYVKKISDKIIDDMYYMRKRKIIINNCSFYKFVIIMYLIAEFNEPKNKYPLIDMDEMFVILITNDKKELNILTRYTSSTINIIFGNHKKDDIMKIYDDYIYFDLLK
jgi:hypothetical protein